MSNKCGVGVRWIRVLWGRVGPCEDPRGWARSRIDHGARFKPRGLNFNVSL